MTSINKMLISRRYLMLDDSGMLDRKQNQAWVNAYLFANFGIMVDRPDLLTMKMVKDISDEYRLNVPKSYFANPQDMKFYTCEELFLEQIVSYFLAYGADESHVRLFEKDLPEYMIGTDMKIREFCILDREGVNEVLMDICKNLEAYKRPWSLDEQAEFELLYNEGFYDFKDEDFAIKCGDNAVFMLDKNARFASFLYKKDLVKLSVTRVGEQKNLMFDTKTLGLIVEAIKYVKDCPMSKKQAKYFNKLRQITGADVKKADNKQSPNRIAVEKAKAGDIVGAAEVFAKNGSLLERNLKFLLSRANPVEAVKIIDMLSDKNPIVLYQLMSSIMADTEEARTFTFYAKNRIKKHAETEYEARWRKSRLNDATKKLVHDTCLEKIAQHYRASESLGKVYIDKAFYKVALPVNTSASGKGIDVAPTGTRLPITAPNIRTFVHWEDAFDIDSSVVAYNEKNEVITTMNFCNYSGKYFGNDLLFSGDVTSAKGTEYFDLKLEGLKKRGVHKVLFTFHGYSSTLDKGEIYCGYQQKTDLMTKAWDPKNIELKMHVKGEKRAYIGFIIDIDAMEVVVLNLMTDEDSRVVRGNEGDMIKAYFDESKLELNMGLIASLRGEVVETPEDAEVVFADDYKPAEGQTVIRSFDIEKLVAITAV